MATLNITTALEYTQDGVNYTIDITFVTANETPSMIQNVYFVRYYPSSTYALMN